MSYHYDKAIVNAIADEIDKRPEGVSSYLLCMAAYAATNWQFVDYMLFERDLLTKTPYNLVKRNGRIYPP